MNGRRVQDADRQAVAVGGHQPDLAVAELDQDTAEHGEASSEAVAGTTWRMALASSAPPILASA